MAPNKKQEKGKGKAAAEPLDRPNYPVEEEMPPPRLPQYFLTSAERLMKTDAYRAHQERQESGEGEEPASGLRRTEADTAAIVGLIRGDDDDADGVTFVNPGEVPAGLGVWHWLQPEVDGVRARELGFDHPAQVELARSEGLFTNGLGENAGPVTVWYPRSEYFNPPHQPEGPGRWAYHMTDDRDWADTNLGGQIDLAGWYDFTNVPHPTAAQVWAARRRHFDADGTLDSHRSRDLNIVWVPGNVEDEEGSEQETEQEQSEGEENEVGRTAAGQIDPNSGLVHNPLNRGENNQTAPDDDVATYYTLQLDGKSFTLDRTRACAGTPRPHLAWIVLKKGVWHKYSSYDKVDWSNAKSVEMLNKWKEQTLPRNGWPKKRENRPTYPDDQREWMLEYVKGKERTSSDIALHELAVAFKERFGTQRPDSGIYALMHRVRGELAKYGGLQPDRPRRGHNLKRKRDDSGEGEGEGSAGEGPSEKTGRKRD